MNHLQGMSKEIQLSQPTELQFVIKVRTNLQPTTDQIETLRAGMESALNKILQRPLTAMITTPEQRSKSLLQRFSDWHNHLLSR